jgi:prophage regulatory protein
MNRFLRLSEVRSAVGLSRSCIYSQISQGRFPRPVRLGSRSVGWAESDIAGWIADRIAASAAANAPQQAPTPAEQIRRTGSVS